MECTCARGPLTHSWHSPDCVVQWVSWLAARGLACVRHVAERLPADEALFAFLSGLLLHTSEESVDQIAEARIVCPQEASARHTLVISTSRLCTIVEHADRPFIVAYLYLSSQSKLIHELPTYLPHPTAHNGHPQHTTHHPNEPPTHHERTTSHRHTAMYVTSRCRQDISRAYRTSSHNTTDVTRTILHPLHDTTRHIPRR